MASLSIKGKLYFCMISCFFSSFFSFPFCFARLFCVSLYEFLGTAFLLKLHQLHGGRRAKIAGAGTLLYNYNF